MGLRHGSSRMGRQRQRCWTAAALAALAVLAVALTPLPPAAAAPKAPALSEGNRLGAGGTGRPHAVRYPAGWMMPNPFAVPLLHAESIMLRLRQSIRDADAVIMAGWDGWQPGNPAHHCSWHKVKCDDQQRVTSM